MGKSYQAALTKKKRYEQWKTTAVEWFKQAKTKQERLNAWRKWERARIGRGTFYPNWLAKKQLKKNNGDKLRYWLQLGLHVSKELYAQVPATGYCATCGGDLNSRTKWCCPGTCWEKEQKRRLDNSPLADLVKKPEPKASATDRT